MDREHRRFWSAVERFAGPGFRKRDGHGQLHTCPCCQSPGSLTTWRRAAKKSERQAWRAEAQAAIEEAMNG